MEYVRCNFCNSSNLKFVAKSKDFIHKTSSKTFSIVKCEKCGLNFTNPRPTISEIKKNYSSNYSFFKNDNLLKSILRIFFIWISKIDFLCYIFNFLPWFRKKIILHLKTKKIKYPLNITSKDIFLDIGSGSGVGNTHWWGPKESIKEYCKRNKNIYAVEPNKEAHKVLNNYVLKSYYLIDDIEDNILFDKIRLNWSLEHVHDPQKYFDFFSKKLKKNGEILICIPNFDGHIYSIDPSISELPIHLYHFKFKNIEDYCKRNNLKITYFKTFSYVSMYYLTSLVFDNDYFLKFRKISIKSLKKFQIFLNSIDDRNLGNDMIFKITHDK